MSVTLKIVGQEVQVWSDVNGTLEGSFRHDLPPKGIVYKKKVQRGWSVYGPTWTVHHVSQIQVMEENETSGDTIEVKDL